METLSRNGLTGVITVLSITCFSINFEIQKDGKM